MSQYSNVTNSRYNYIPMIDTSLEQNSVFDRKNKFLQILIFYLCIGDNKDVCTKTCS